MSIISSRSARGPKLGDAYYQPYYQPIASRISSPVTRKLTLTSLGCLWWETMKTGMLLTVWVPIKAHHKLINQIDSVAAGFVVVSKQSLAGRIVKLVRISLQGMVLIFLG